MKKTLIIFFSFWVAAGFAQSTEELQKQISHASIEEKPALLMQLANSEKKSDGYKSIDHYKDALLIARELGDSAVIVQALQSIGDGYRRMCNFDVALEYYLDLMDFAVKADDQKLQAKTNRYLGMVYDNLGYYNKAMEYLKRAVSMSEELVYAEEMPEAYLILGNVYKNLGSYEQAISYYQKSQEKFEDTENQGGISRCLNNIGIIKKKQAKYEEALDYYFKALHIKEELGEKLLIGSTLNNIATIYEKMEDFETSLTFYQQAIDLFREVNNERFICSVLNNIGLLKKKQGDEKEAEEYYREGLKIANKIEYAKASASCYNNLALLYSGQEKYAQARENFEAALQIFRGQGSKTGMSHCLINIGGLYLEEKKYSLAKECFEQSLALAKEIGDLKIEQNVYSALSEFYNITGDAEKKFENYRQFTVIKDSIFNEELKEKVAELQLKYEADKTAKELDLLRKDNEIYRLNSLKNRLFRQVSLLVAAITLLVIIFMIIRYNLSNRSRKKLEKEIAQRAKVEEQLRNTKRELNQRVLQRTEELSLINVSLQEEIKARMAAEEELRYHNTKLTGVIQETVKALLQAMESRDFHTGLHLRRVEQLAAAIAIDLQFSQERIDSVRFAALLHDIGKLSIPVEILRKQGSLNQYEESLIKSHPEAGVRILESIDFPWPVCDIVLQHHEEYDGSGYPQGLAGSDIALEARILHVADVMANLTAHHSYMPAMDVSQSLDIISQGSGTRFDPLVVASCIKLFTKDGFHFSD